MSDHAIGGGDKRPLTTPDCYCIRGGSRWNRQHQWDPENCASDEPVPEQDMDDADFVEPDDY